MGTHPIFESDFDCLTEMRFTKILMNIGAKYKNARALLDVEVGATKKEIHSAYLAKAKELHPDASFGIHELDPKEAEAKFQEVGEAYQLLIKPQEATKSDASRTTADFDENDIFDIAMYGHGLDPNGFPLVADIAFAKEILGVEPDATKEEVQKVYAELSLVSHPDIGDIPDPDKFRVITEAYKTFMSQEILSTGQVKYIDVVDTLDWSVAGRQKIHRGRYASESDSFFGFDDEELKPKNIWAKVVEYGRNGVRHSVKTMHAYRGAIRGNVRIDEKHGQEWKNQDK